MAVILTKHLGGFSRSPEDEVSERISSGRTESFLYVAPTKRKVRSIQRDFLSLCPSKASGPFMVFTLETLAAWLHDLLLPPKRLLSPQMQAAFVQEAIRARAAELAYFPLRGHARRLPRGTLAKITNVINRLKGSGVYLSTIMQELGDGDESELLKLRDIAAIYATYEELLGDAYVDPPGLFKDVNFEWTKPSSADTFRAAHPGVDLLAVTGFDEFSDPELTLLNALSEVPGLGTVVSFDYHPGNDELFGHLGENYNKFLAMGFRPAGSQAVGMPPFHARIARTLFATRPGPDPGFDATATVTACPAPDRVREAELIAKIIRTAVADTPGLGPGEICVCMPRPDLYAQIFREVFEQAGIPANVTDRFRLEESALVTGIVSMLQLAQNNFRIEDIVRAGTNPFLEIATGGRRLDAPNLLRTAAELRTVSGRKRWSERIAARARFLRDAHPDEEGYGSAREEAEALRLQKAEEDLETLDRLVAPLRAPMTPAQFREAVLRLVIDLRVVWTLAGAGSTGVTVTDVEREARAYAELLRFLDEFPDVLSLESPPGEAHPAGWYMERFRPLLSQVRYNVRQRYGEGVLVTSIDETRGLSFRVMIIAGLVDGEFPSVYEPEVFLTPKRRARMERYHLHEQRYLFYQALSGCTGRIYITWPLKENDVDLNPSGFLEWLGGSALITRFGADAEHPYARTLVTADEVLARNVEDAERGGTGAVPDHVREAVAVETARRRDEGSDPYRGFLDAAAPGPGGAPRLASFRNASYSVTQLETYGDCPFKFFAGRVLGLRVPEPPEEGLSPREMGRLLHEILFEFYMDRRTRGLAPIARLDDAGFAAALSDLLAIAARKFDAAAVDDVFWEISREVVLGSPGRPGTLEAMLASERSSAVGAVPSYFEVRFGRAGEDLKYSDPELFADAPVSAGEIFLQGKIDRIDTAGGAFRVVDYKTGALIPSKRDVDSGASLQLPLYLHCAEALLSGKTGRPAAGGAGIYYHLRPEFEAVARIGNNEYRGELLDPGRRFRLDDGAEALRARISAAVSRANEYAQRISAGRFPVDPRDPSKVCRRCDFRRMCRIRTRMSPDPGQGADGDGAETEHQQRED